jgi:hypothetical protein
MLGPTKSPINIKEVGFAEQVITPVEDAKAVALIPTELGIAPTH